MMILYHVTPKRNVNRILKNGLEPQIGKYASEMEEKTPYVWLFPCLEDAYEMIPVWLEPFYETELSILEIRLPDGFPLEYTGSDYEVVSKRQIPAEYISVYA